MKQPLFFWFFLNLQNFPALLFFKKYDADLMLGFP